MIKTLVLDDFFGNIAVDRLGVSQGNNTILPSDNEFNELARFLGKIDLPDVANYFLNRDKSVMWKMRDIGGISIRVTKYLKDEFRCQLSIEKHSVFICMPFEKVHNFADLLMECNDDQANNHG